VESAAPMKAMTMSSPARKSQTGEPTDNTGHFGTTAKPEGAVELRQTPTRTPFGGYELRGYQGAGTGRKSAAWSATLYFDGVAAVHVTDEGHGEPVRLIDGTTGIASGAAIDGFTETAAVFFPYADEPAAQMSATLAFSAQLDQIARRSGATREQVVDDHIEAGQIGEHERLLFSDPDEYLTIQYS
jgi:hypothetical protein